MTNCKSQETEASPNPAQERLAHYAIHSRQLAFQWRAGQPPLQFPDLALPRGEHLFVRGPSGSGKSTLLSLLGGLASPSRGQLHLLGEDVTRLGRAGKDRLRADHIGVIFQQFNLVPYLSALGNVELPCRLSTVRRQRSNTGDARSLLASLAIPQDHWQRPVNRLSIGQQQRVAAARALMGSPELILADEPTSALDSDNRDRFLELLLDLAGQRQASVVFVSHDRSLARWFPRRLSLEVSP